MYSVSLLWAFFLFKGQYLPIAIMQTKQVIDLCDQGDALRAQLWSERYSAQKWVFNDIHTSKASIANRCTSSLLACFERKCVCVAFGEVETHCTLKKKKKKS